MNDSVRIGCTIICLILGLISGVQAISISSVTYNIADNGTSTIDMQYHLNSSEKLQYSIISKVVDLSALGKEQLESISKKPVTITSITPESASFVIEDFATSDGDILTVPKIDYVLDTSVVSPVVQQLIQKFEINYVPEKTIIIFPNGHKESFENQISIPSVSNK